jgi:hypothetical protein
MVVLGILGVLFNSNNIFVYGYLLVGILQLGTYLYENNKQYLTIENGIISKNHLTPKKIHLKELKGIKKFAGDYVLQTDSTELRINTEFIDEKSLIELNILLENSPLKSK